MLSAYYFRAHMYTIVPRHVREDMAWLADHGVDAVVIGVLEQDLFAARENMDLICEAAGRSGLRVMATPSRWGSLVAGSPKVPSILCAINHDCWARKADGSPHMGFLGPLASIHHPATVQLFEESLLDMLRSWPFTGIVWDELKNLHVVDYSPAARNAMGVRWNEDVTKHQMEMVSFLGRLNTQIKAANTACRTSLFVHAFYEGSLLERLAGTPELDDFGCDGRPWAMADGGADDNGEGSAPAKLLVDAGPRFIAAARTANRNPLALIENHALPAGCNPLMDRRLPEILRQGWGHVLFYYYPRSCEAPDASMHIIGQHLKAWRASHLPTRAHA